MSADLANELNAEIPARQDRSRRLAETLGVERRGMDDDQLFEACLRVIARNMGTAL